MVTVSVLKSASQETYADIRVLLAELRGEAKSRGTLAQLKKMVADKNTTIIVAKDGRRIVGVALLFTVQKLGRNFGLVEDVVVSSEYRGQGLGKRLMRAVIAAGRKRKLSYLFLTSKPARVSANMLYKKLGFELVKTNPYRMRL
ncbi:MAG: GNAT family N-acetyltransferase [Patescibacteria group bacterium]|nr:GNAT family N-acetyltransferase [Patescibacteria group bacterium]